MMNTDQIKVFQGRKIVILEMLLKNVDNQLELWWKINFENTVFRMTFYSVSRFSVGELSLPLEIHGFEIIDHSLNGWGEDSTYEVRDFEDGRLNFFCECFNIH